jgi:hypothetical protein
MLPATLFRHRHAACRSALVLAALFRRRTPLQQFVVSGPFPVAYEAHGAMDEPT